MKYVIAKEFEHISVAIFGPAKISIELSTIHYCAELCQQSEQPGWFNFFGQLGFNDVIVGESGIQLIVKSRTWNNRVLHCWTVDAYFMTLLLGRPTYSIKTFSKYYCFIL